MQDKELYRFYLDYYNTVVFFLQTAVAFLFMEFMACLQETDKFILSSRTPRFSLSFSLSNSSGCLDVVTIA